MTATHPHGDRESLWAPVGAPILWSVHFTICYIAAAMWCGRFASWRPEAFYGGMAVLTLVTVAGMAMLFVRGYRRRRAAWPERPHDADTPEDRRHFLAFTTMLLAGLSIVGTVFGALSIALVPGCG